MMENISSTTFTSTFTKHVRGKGLQQMQQQMARLSAAVPASRLQWSGTQAAAGFPTLNGKNLLEKCSVPNYHDEKYKHESHYCRLQHDLDQHKFHSKAHQRNSKARFLVASGRYANLTNAKDQNPSERKGTAQQSLHQDLTHEKAEESKYATERLAPNIKPSAQVRSASS